MPYQNIPSVFPVSGGTTSINQTVVIDDSTDSAATIFFAPKTGTITKINFNVSASSGSPAVRVGLQGVASGAREPNGSFIDYQDINPTTGWHTATISVSVTAGDQLAAVVEHQNGSTTVVYGLFTELRNSWESPYAIRRLNSTYATLATSIPYITVEYNDGQLTGGVHSNWSSIGWSTSGSPLYRGMKWTPTANFKINGITIACMRSSTSSTSHFNALIMEGSNGTPIFSRLIVANEMMRINNVAGHIHLSFPEIELQKNIPYRFMIEPTTSTNFIVIKFEFISNQAWRYINLDENWLYTTSTSLGTYIDTANEFIYIMPKISSVEVPEISVSQFKGLIL